MSGRAVTLIRPSLPPVTPASQGLKPADAARLAAQKAFFEIAAGQASAPAAPAKAALVQAVSTTGQAPASAPVQRLPEAPAARPTAPLRPGSLLDIKV